MVWIVSSNLARRQRIARPPMNSRVILFGVISLATMGALPLTARPRTASRRWWRVYGSAVAAAVSAGMVAFAIVAIGHDRLLAAAVAEAVAAVVGTASYCAVAARARDRVALGFALCLFGSELVVFTSSFTSYDASRVIADIAGVLVIILGGVIVSSRARSILGSR